MVAKLWGFWPWRSWPSRPWPARRGTSWTRRSSRCFKTLVAAVKAAGLVDTLKGEGPFTVMAPTDEAFARLPEGTVESLLKPENKEKLVAILKYHVIPAKAMAVDVIALDGKEVKTVEGSSARIAVKDGSVMIDGAKVIKPNIECTNGVIHVIDAVILPPSARSIDRRSIGRAVRSPPVGFGDMRGHDGPPGYGDTPPAGLRFSSSPDRERRENDSRKMQ